MSIGNSHPVPTKHGQGLGFFLLKDFYVAQLKEVLLG